MSHPLALVHQSVSPEQSIQLSILAIYEKGANTGYTYQPESFVYETDSISNGTMAVMLLDLDPYVTPFITSMINSHIVALGMYQAG